MAKKKAPDSVLDLIVSFGNVSAGDKTARIGVSMDRGVMKKLTDVDATFCERRLNAVLIVKANGDHPDQRSLDGMEPDETEIESVFDVKRVSFTKDDLSFGLTAALGEIDVGKFAKFAKRTGRLIVNGVSDIPEGSNLEIEGDDE